MGLPCMNCKKDVGSADGKFFAEAYVCGDCFIVAERLYKQGQCELQQMLVTLKELIRTSIVQGQLSLPPAPEVDLQRGEVPQRKAIDAIVEMMKCTKDSNSSQTLKQNARIQDVPGSASSNSTEESRSEKKSTRTPPTGSSGNA